MPTLAQRPATTLLSTVVQHLPHANSEGSRTRRPPLQMTQTAWSATPSSMLLMSYVLPVARNLNPKGKVVRVAGCRERSAPRENLVYGTAAKPRQSEPHGPLRGHVDCAHLCIKKLLGPRIIERLDVRIPARAFHEEAAKMCTPPAGFSLTISHCASIMMKWKAIVSLPSWYLRRNANTYSERQK